MRIDYRRAKEVFALMLARYEKREYPYHNLENDLPQNLVAPWIREDPKRFARHLFFACHYMRGTIITRNAFLFLNDLHSEFPWLFTYEVLLRSPQEVAEVLKTKIAWEHQRVARMWLRNARILVEKWGDDPRTLFKGSPSREALYRRVMGKRHKRWTRKNGRRVLAPSRYQSFAGFKEKMTSMLAYFLEATDLIEPTPLSAPVDYHHFRVYLATGMIVIEGDSVSYERIRRVGVKLAEKLQADFELSQVAYADVVWLWSVRSCRGAPHNQTKQIGRFERELIPVVWSDAQVSAHARTCGRCTIAAHCRYGVPAGVYYTTGVFTLIDCTNPPQGALFHPTDIPVAFKNGDRDLFRERFAEEGL